MGRHYEIAQRWMALWNGDLSELETLIASEIVVHAAVIGRLDTGPLVGREALRDWITAAHGMLPAVRFSIEVGPIADGEMMVVRWRGKGSHGAADIDFTGTDTLRIKDGRIGELWTNADTMLMLQQAGMIPLA